MRNYPVIAPFYDRYSGRLVTAYKYVEQKKLDAYVTELYRKYKPEVVVSHDVKGEYGHGMHMAVAIAALDNVAHAMNPKRHAASYKEYGPAGEKVYLHLYRKTVLTWTGTFPCPPLMGKQVLRWRRMHGHAINRNIIFKISLSCPATMSIAAISSAWPLPMWGRI